MQLENKTCLVTGASSGIGEALAVHLAREKATVVLVARRAAKLEAVAERCRSVGGLAHIVVADLSTEDGCRRMIDEVASSRGGIDVLLLNAGVSHHGTVERIEDPQIFADLMQTNYLGPVYCTWRALPHLKASKGAIVVVSSLQGKAAFPGFAGYSASKHALHGFFDSLRSELHGTGVSVTLACPGPVASGIRDGRSGDEPGLMSSERCAEIIVAALHRRRREVVMTMGGRLGAKLRPLFPTLIDNYVRRRVIRFFQRP